MDFPHAFRSDVPASDIAPEFKSHEPFRFGDTQSFQDLLGPHPVWPRPLELPKVGRDTDPFKTRPPVFVPASADNTSRIDSLEQALVDVRNQLARTHSQLEAHAALIHDVSVRMERAERETERLLSRVQEHALTIQGMKVIQFKNQMDTGADAGADMRDTQ